MHGVGGDDHVEAAWAIALSLELGVEVEQAELDVRLRAEALARPFEEGLADVGEAIDACVRAAVRRSSDALVPPVPAPISSTRNGGRRRCQTAPSSSKAAAASALM